MVDKGKAALSPRELAEQEKRARIKEWVDQWMRSLELGHPIPPELLNLPEPSPIREPPPHPVRYRFGPWQAGPSHSDQPEPDSPRSSPEPRRIYYFGRTPPEPSYQDLRDPDSPEYTPASPPQSPIVIPDNPDSPYYTPASPQPEPDVITDWVSEDVLVDFWDSTARPIPPNLGPWYRFVYGFIQFRYGTSWATIDRMEREAAWDRRYARAMGEEKPDIPPPHQPGEILFHIQEEPETPPIARHVPLVPDPPVEEEEEPIDEEPIDEESMEEEEMEPIDEGLVEPEEEDDEPMDPSEAGDSSQGGDEDQGPRAWSDTSTITDEPSLRRPIWARRRVGARRTG